MANLSVSFIMTPKRKGLAKVRLRSRSLMAVGGARNGRHRTLELTVGRRVPGPRELAWFEHGLAALRDTPLDGSERLDVLALLSNHVRGSVQQVAAAADPESALAEALQPILQAHADRFPQTAAAFESAATSGRRDEGFRFGVDRILDGVATLMQTRARA